MNLRRIGLCSVVLLAPLIVGSGAASADPATVIPIFQSDPLPTTNTLPECFEQMEGVQSGTETFVGQLVVSGDGSTHVHGTTTLDYTVTFPDGRYVTGIATEHITFNITKSVTTSTVAIVEPRTIFDANGTPTGKVLLHAVSHLTDQAGEIRSTVDRFFFTCH
jgi:hypothetical protein